MPTEVLCFELYNGHQRQLTIQVLDMNTNPIIIIDDDEDDLEITRESFAELKIKNEVITFNDGSNLLSSLKLPIKSLFLYSAILI